MNLKIMKTNKMTIMIFGIGNKLPKKEKTDRVCLHHILIGAKKQKNSKIEKFGMAIEECG